MGNSVPPNESPPTQEEKSQLFADLHVPGKPFVIPNPWDIGSAVMMTSLGFKALASTSAGYAFSIGKTDGTVDRAQMMAHIADLVKASHLPVSADLENGYGINPRDVAQTIVQGYQAGLVGASIEDTSGQSDKPIFDIDIARERVIAAAEVSRKLPIRFMLCARAENFLWGNPDLKDTIKRLQAYQEAGADLLYAPGLTNIDQVRSVVSSVDLPVNVIASSLSTFTFTELGQAGVARISLGSAMARAAYGAMLDSAQEILGNGGFSFAATIPGFKRFNQLLDSDQEK